VRRDFVANVSHELRTPVSVISANAETLLTGARRRCGRGRFVFVALDEDGRPTAVG
jgi:two-component system phosphate regulon sensor histidine kinase PhoR